MKKAQISTEFVLITVFMMFLFIVMFLGLQNRSVELHTEQDVDIMSQIANIVSNEVQLAAKVGDGYRRQFFLPLTLYGEPYQLLMAGETPTTQWDLVIVYNGLEYVQFLDVPVQGQINVSNNEITNVNGIVTIVQV